MLNVVALIAPIATVTRIENGKVTEKHKVDVPDSVGDIVVCPDRFCITNHEQVPCKFVIAGREPFNIEVSLLRNRILWATNKV